MARGKLLFLVTEDWFFRSHFMPMLRRAQEEGYEVVVAGRMGEARADLVAAGARTIDLPDERGVYGVPNLARSGLRLAGVLRRERPAIVHAIALRPILLARLVSPAAPCAHALAVTGRGYLATTRSSRTAWALGLVRALIARRVRAGRAVLLVENDDDRAWVAGEVGLPEASVIHLPGAGVEIDRYVATPEPPSPPLRVGMVSRLVHSKGADVAVEAVRRLRAGGVEVELSIAGAQDFDNPAAVTTEELASWAATAGIDVLGRVSDISGFWATMHAGVLPSRGGEGLPRSLLEAAACGRAVVTTRVPGCADFVREGENGLLIAPEDVDALASALRTLAQDRDLRRRMGDAARARVLGAYTTRHAADCAAEAWRRLSDGDGG